MEDGWKLVEVEPETVAVNGNSLDAIRPTVELVPGTVPNVNGHHDGANEPQQSPFSWAEFTAVESAMPKKLGRKPPPATLWMVEWALSRGSARPRRDVRASHAGNGTGFDVLPLARPYLALSCAYAYLQRNRSLEVTAHLKGRTPLAGDAVRTWPCRSVGRLLRCFLRCCSDWRSRVVVVASIRTSRT